MKRSKKFEHPEIDYVIGELMALKKQVSDLESAISRQGTFINKIASDVDGSD